MSANSIYPFGNAVRKGPENVGPGWDSALGKLAFVHTYQVRIPGESWRTVANDTLDMNFGYTPGNHCASGTYAFRAQTVLYANHSLHSGWSAPAAVSVTA